MPYERITATVPQGPVKITDRKEWRRALNVPRPLLVHLNADTTWLIQIPYPDEAIEATKRPPGRSHFNLLLDPWLQGPQSDVASWFSTQWHMIAPAVSTIAELNSILAELEAGNVGKGGDEDGDSQSRCGMDEMSSTTPWFIDAVAISHEFTDHCHQATLEELPPDIPVFAADEAATLIGSWGHFNHVVTAPPFSSVQSDREGWQGVLSVCHPFLPSWLGIGRVVTAGNSLYYHSALLIAFQTPFTGQEQKSKDTSRPITGQAIIYSPHGIQAGDLECIPASGLESIALLHGLHDVRIWMTAQLNLGALNGIQAVRACGARYWVGTHDEVKRGGGFISWLLRRTVYSLGDAVEAEKAKLEGTDGKENNYGDYQFLELGSGDALVLI